MKIIRPDYILSYWVFIWYILYILNFVQNSPKFALIMGIIENICTLVVMIYKKTHLRYILFFVVINIFLKGFPLVTIIHDKITKKDIYLTICIIFIYNLWLYINGTNIINLYNLVTTKHFKTPIMYFFDYYL